MKKITATMASYFQNPAHASVNEFHFCSNGSAFIKKGDAEANAANIKKNKSGSDEVVSVTRAEVEAWVEAQKAAPEAPVSSSEGEGGVTDPGKPAKKGAKVK